MAQAFRGTRTYLNGADNANYSMSWSGFDIWFPVTAGVQILKDGVVTQAVNFTTTGGDSGDANGNIGVTADTSQTWRAFAYNADFSIRVSNQLGFKSYANTVVFGTIVADNPTTTSMHVFMQFHPNTVESLANGIVQYKKSTDALWTDSAITLVNQQGSGTSELDGTISGLTPGTSYNFRTQVTRNTNNDTLAYSVTATTSTLVPPPVAPTITTTPATGVAYTSASLTAVVDPNGFSTDVSFEWDTNSGVPYANTTSPAQNFTGDGDQGASYNLTGLTFSTTYYYRAKAVYSGGTVYGGEQSFTTPVNPQAVAAQEDHMTIFEFNERKTGVQSVINFAVSSPSGTTSDRFFNSASPFVAGDVKVSIDGAAFANVTNLPVRVGTTPNFALTLTTAEMSGYTIVVMIVDQDGPAFRDAMLVVRTKQEIGQFDANSTGIGGNTSAMLLTGVGSGSGLEATGGTTGTGIKGVLGSHVLRSGIAQAGSAGSTIVLDASASTSDDFYNGAIVVVTSGVGIGQARVITDYAQASKTATVHKTWTTIPGTGAGFLIMPGEDLWEVSPVIELSTLPTSASSFGKLMQFVFQRFAYKRTQTSNTHTMFKSDSSTSLATTSVSDSAGTQTFNKLA